MESGTVHGDRPHAAIAGHSRCDADDLIDGRGGTITEGGGQRVRAQVYRQRCPLVGFHLGHQRQQGVTGRRVVRASVQDDRRHAQVHAREQRLEFLGCHTGLAHPDQQRADPVAKGGKQSGVLVGGGRPAGKVARKRLGNPPAGLDVAQGVAATQVGPLARQRRFRQLVERGIQGPNDEPVIRR